LMAVVIYTSDYYRATVIMQFCEKKESYWDLTHSRKVSYRRTFRILEKLDLVNRRHTSRYVHPFYTFYSLTDKGKKVAQSIEKEIADLIKEFEHLI